MPLTYNPGVSYHGDQYLAQIGGNMRNNALAILGVVNDQKQLKADASAADAVWKSFQTRTEQNADTPGGGTVTTTTPNPLGDKDEWDTLGARDKVARMKAMTVVMGQQALAGEHEAQMRKYAADAQERQQRALSWKDFSQRINARNLQPGADTNPITPQEILNHAMASGLVGRDATGVAAMVRAADDARGQSNPPFQFNPRTMVQDLGAADPRLAGTFYGQTSTHGGQFLQTPEALANKAGVVAEQQAAGRAAGTPEKTKSLPTAYDTAMQKLDAELAPYQDKVNASDEDLNRFAKTAGAPAQQRASAQKRLDAVLARKKQLINSYSMRGYETPEFWDNERALHGVGAAPAPAAAGGSAGATPGAGDRVQVKDKQGQLFTVPRAQLQQALAAGYSPIQ